MRCIATRGSRREGKQDNSNSNCFSHRWHRLLLVYFSALHDPFPNIVFRIVRRIRRHPGEYAVIATQWSANLAANSDQILEPSPAIKLIVTARTTAPSRYDSKACRSTVARIEVKPISVSETWKVIPTV